MRLLRGKSEGNTRQLVDNNKFRKHAPIASYKTELMVEDNDYIEA